ncbi:uncharacterized protein LOC121372468 isoform X3 [Gigantopelta aegis]|uniref:uncharacterized protein LOC121372468 isoform X3 n=1 Tax=Gigantopelta aegis TaxID=1735272 RepID=UPI001B88DF3A|nr:uncharacterized protein LOC121372468 isoform X3 [Gigantopelta aegis]
MEIKKSETSMVKTESNYSDMLVQDEWTNKTSSITDPYEYESADYDATNFGLKIPLSEHPLVNTEHDLVIPEEFEFTSESCNTTSPFEDESADHAVNNTADMTSQIPECEHSLLETEDYDSSVPAQGELTVETSNTINDSRGENAEGVANDTTIDLVLQIPKSEDSVMNSREHDLVLSEKDEWINGSCNKISNDVESAECVIRDSTTSVEDGEVADIVLQTPEPDQSTIKTEHDSFTHEFTSEMTDTTIEEAVVDNLFFTCDIDKKGLVLVSSIIRYLRSNILHHQLQSECELSTLSHLLDPDGDDVIVDIVTYRKAMMKWIGDIRRESGENDLSEEEAHLNSTTPNSPAFRESLLSVYSNSYDASQLTDISHFSDCDIADLSNKLEILQYQYKRQGEDYAKLQQQIDSQEETITSLSQENLAVSKQIKSLQEISSLRSGIQTENEELKTVVVRYQETKRDLEHRLCQMDRDNTILVENAERYRIRIQQLLSDLDASRCQIKALQKELTEQKLLMTKLHDDKSFQEVQLAEKEIQNKDLLASVHELSRVIEDLRSEYKDLQLELIHTQQQLENLENLGEEHLSMSVGCDDYMLDDEELGSRRSSFSSCGFKRSSSIHNELKAVLDHSPLPSPLCERDHSSKMMMMMENSPADSFIIDAVWGNIDLELSPHKEEHLVTDLVKLVEKCKGKYNPLLKEIYGIVCKPESTLDVHRSRSWPSIKGEPDVEETSAVHSIKHLKQLVCILCRLEAENEQLKQLHYKSVEILETSKPDMDKTAEERFFALQTTLMEERIEKLSLQEELESVKSKFGEMSDELQQKFKEIVILHAEIEKLHDSVTNLTRANLDLSEKYHCAELTSTKLQETLEREKQICSELEGHLSKAKLARQVDLQDIWRLVHKEAEMEYVDDQNDSPVSSSTDLLKDQISKEIETLKGQLVKRQAALGVLKGKQMSLELGSLCRQYNPAPHSPSSPLVDALTIDFFDGRYGRLRQSSKKVCTFSGLAHHSFDMDKSRYDDSRLAPHHTLSCPSLHQNRQQCAWDGNRNIVSYTSLNTSSSSSTSGIDTSPRYHRSTDGQNKRRDFIRSSARHENSSTTTTTTSNSADSNTASDCSYLKQQQQQQHNVNGVKSPAGVRRFSFKAAIENRKDMNDHGQPLPRNRSSSYHSAIEQGQKDCTEDVGYASSTTDTTPENVDSHHDFMLGHAGPVRTDGKSVSFHLKAQNVYEYCGDKCSGDDFDVEALDSEEDAYRSFESFEVYHSSQNSRQLLNPPRKLSTLIEEDIDHFDGHGDTDFVSPKKQDKTLKYSRLECNKPIDSAKNISCEKGSSERVPKITTRVMPGKSGKVSYSKEDIYKKALKAYCKLFETTGPDRTGNLASASPLGACHTVETQTTVTSPQRQLKHSPVGQSVVHSAADLNAPSPEGRADPVSKPSTIPSRLAQLRESNLAKKREHMRFMKLPDLQEQMDTNNTIPLNSDSLMNVAVIPPAPSSDPVMPSISDNFLQQLGLKKSAKAFKCDDLSEQEIEAKFLSLSLAFKTDKLTLEQRKDIQERSRDIAERNIDQELLGLRNVVEKLNQLISDVHVHEIVTKIQNHIDVLEQTAARVSSRAEVFGAVQQEMRMSRAMEVMVVHVENVKRSQEKDRLELEEARKQLEKPFGMSSLSELGSKRSMSVCPMNFPQKTRRRSEIALPLILGGSGGASLKHSASLDYPLFMECPPKLGTSQTLLEDPEDARQRFQAAVASTSVQNAITTTLRKASIERQNAISSQSSLSRESSTLSRESSTDRPKEQGSSSPAPSKQSSQDEEAYQKGFEDGVKAKLGKELSDLREQQNSIGNNIEEVMEKVEHSEEELLKENNNSVAKSVIQFQNIATKLSWDDPLKTLRFVAACLIFMVAICVVIMSLFTGTASGVEIEVGRHHYGMPPL